MVILLSDLQGVAVQEELRELLLELPAIFTHTIDLLPSLTPSINYYQAFVTYNTGRLVPDREREGASGMVCGHVRSDSKVLPMLNYIMQHGNVTVYQWKHGIEPEVLLW